MAARDPWSEARARARDEVRAAFAPPRVVCRSCGNEETSAARSCSRCGAPYVRLRDAGISRSTRRRAAIAAAGANAVVGVAAAVIVPSVQESKRHAAARAQADARAALVRERRRVAADQRLHAASPGASPARLRRLSPVRLTQVLRVDLEAAITADARARVRAGTLGGPILGTRCAPADGAGGPRIERYSCTAVNREIVRKPGQAAAGVLGYPFWAVVDTRTLRYRWCKVNPQAGEGSATSGSAALAVPPPRGCDITR